MENPYVGILVNASLYKGIPLGDTRHEMLGFYEEAGRMFRVLPCFFRIQDIKPHSETIKAYVRGPIGYTKKWIPKPKVIHNRAIYRNKSTQQRMEELADSGTILFNQLNRYGKSRIQELLMMNEEIRPHLPETVPASAASLRQMMANYPSLIIKPNSSSIGRGIMKLERTGGKHAAVDDTNIRLSRPSGWKITYPIGKGIRVFRSTCFRQKIPIFLMKKIRSQSYLIQQRLPLATFKGRPFDLRVSVQRNHTGVWQITGIAGKVAKKNRFLTNVAQGGTVYTLEEILQQYPQLDYCKVLYDVMNFSLLVVEHLSLYLPHLADVGLDIGITGEGFPLFIECNGKDQRYSFRKANMLMEWKATFMNPIGYARYLLEH